MSSRLGCHGVACLLALPGLVGGRPQEGAPRKSLTPRAASAAMSPSPTPSCDSESPLEVEEEVRGQSQRSQHLDKSFP